MVNKILDDYIDSVDDGRRYLILGVSPKDFTLEVIKRLQWGQKYNFNVMPKYPDNDSIRKLILNKPRRLREDIEDKVNEMFEISCKQALENFGHYIDNAGINPPFRSEWGFDFALTAPQATLLIECPYVERVQAWFKGTIPLL